MTSGIVSIDSGRITSGIEQSPPFPGSWAGMEHAFHYPHESASCLAPASASQLHPGTVLALAHRQCFRDDAGASEGTHMTVTESTQEALIERHIDANPHGRGPAEARLAEYGPAVWAIVAYWKAANGDLRQVARDFEVPMEAVEAALAFYRLHQDLIDARLVLN